MIRISGLTRRLAPAACGAVVALLVAIPAMGQDTGTVSGTVVDATAPVVPGASVTLTHEGTATVRTLVSNERGESAFRAVTPGSYTVKVELPGFRSLERRSNSNPTRPPRVIQLSARISF